MSNETKLPRVATSLDELQPWMRVKHSYVHRVLTIAERTVSGGWYAKNGGATDHVIDIRDIEAGLITIIAEPPEPTQELPADLTGWGFEYVGERVVRVSKGTVAQGDGNGNWVIDSNAGNAAYEADSALRDPAKYRLTPPAKQEATPEPAPANCSQKFPETTPPRREHDFSDRYCVVVGSPGGVKEVVPVCVKCGCRSGECTPDPSWRQAEEEQTAKLTAARDKNRTAPARPETTPIPSAGYQLGGLGCRMTANEQTGRRVRR